MIYKTTLGSYLSSIYRMNLNFDIIDTPLFIQRLSDKNLSIFIHEYVHFLQDISSYVGLYNAYVCSEHIHTLINLIYKENTPEIHIPIKHITNYGNLDLMIDMNKEILGDVHEQDSIFAPQIKIENIKLKNRNPYAKYSKRIMIKNHKGKLHFSGMAIMESMAYLIEKQITSGSVAAPEYPYNSAEIVTNLVYPEFGRNILNIIALCDMSIQYSNPGAVFYEALLNFRENHILPSTPESIIEYFYKKDTYVDGKNQKFIDSILLLGITVGECLKSYLDGFEFKDFHQVVNTLIGYGLRQRYYNHNFILDFVKNGNIRTNTYFYTILQNIGSPIICDKSENYWIIHPIGKNEKNYAIDYFPAIMEIFKALKDGNDCCEMLDWCSVSGIHNIDDRCINAPWLHCQQNDLCPYGILWKKWGLANKTIIKNDTNL